MKEFWIVYVEGTDGGDHFKHHDLRKAVGEAQRLARLPGVEGLEALGVIRQVERAPKARPKPVAKAAAKPKKLAAKKPAAKKVDG